MNILELDSFNLADAVKFNDRLNPRLWSGNKMRPEVREKLLAIAADFKESLGLNDLDVKDITVSGSNAGFTYTPHSDIDLHLVVRMPEQCDEVYQELFNAKKYEYNNEHDIKIGGYDVELYVQPANQPHVSAGVYSVMNDDWVHIPRKVPATTDDAVVKDKYDLVKSAIESALKSKDINKMRKVWDKVKEMRKAGLAKNGELGPENLAFKMLRTQGDLGELKDTIRRARDSELSLAEQNKERKPFVYGFKNVEEDAGETWDGVNPTTCMFLNEQDPVSDEDILRDFITFVAKELKLKELPIIKLRRDPQWPVVHTTFGRYIDDRNMLEVAWGQRHIMDVLRTVAHELTHRRQHEREDVPMDAGETGSPYENEANARAGILMRDYARLHPEYFEKGQAQGLHGDEINESVLIGNTDNKVEKFNWADWAQIDPITGQGLSIESVMEICETHLLKTRNLLESNTTEGVSYFKDLFNLGVDPAPGSKYLMTMLMLVNDKILVGHGIEIVKVIKETSPGEYIVKLSNGKTAKFPQNAAMSNTMYHTFFFTNKSQYEKLKTAIKLKFDTDLTESASGYIPKNKKEAQDPRYAMALTVDIKPGQTGREANKLALDTDRQGKPGLLMKTVNLREAREGAMREIIRKALPGWPDYVIKDWISSRIKNEKDLKDLTGWMSELNKMVVPNSWKLHQKMFLTFDMLNPQTRYFMKTKRQFGAKNPFLIPRDEERSANAEQLIRTQGMESLPPVIMLQHANGLALQEGWHRTMAAFRVHPEGFYINAWVGQAIEKSVTEGKIKLSTDPNWYGAEVGDYKASGPVVNIPTNRLVGFEPDDKMNQPASKANVEKIVAGLKQGAKLPPLLVRQYKNGYQVLDGHHRFWAYKLLGVKSIPAQVVPAEDVEEVGKQDVAEDSLASNLLKEYRLFEEQDLFEIKMSPSSLKAEAAKTGAIAGMEFEMIVPNVQANEEPEYEPDYDQDQRSRSFSDIREFFYDGDYNGRRDVDRLEEAVREQYEEWLWEKLDDAWIDRGEEYLKEYIEVNDEFDEEEANQEATNALQAEYGDDISAEEFQKMLDAMVAEKFNEFVDEAWANQGRLYDNARESFMDEMRDEYDDEREWLDENYPYMSDISNNFDISWPYYTTGDEGELDIESVADDFSSAVGMKTNWSSSYHGGRREPNAYVVEPDGSLDPDDSNDGGLEFVSPPMPIDQMIEQLNKVKAWADDRGCYTNRSTGLHINISVPNYDLAKLDYVKLALLLGDKYVLDQYGRSSNTYAKSALGKVQDLIRRDPSKGKDLLDKMRGHMEDLATKAIHSGSTDKYTSINTKSGYIEFRSPGGDWLNENFDKIENTLMRFTVALSAAMDPEAYREEYLKKLYKLLEPVAEEAKNKDTIKFFSDYVAGKMPKAALRSFIKQAQLERKLKRDPTGGEKYWWRVDKEGRDKDGASIELVATSREEALQKARQEWNIPDGSTAMARAEAYPIRPFDTSAVKAQVGEPQAVGQQGNWGIWIINADRFANQPGEYPRGATPPMYRFPSREAAEQWIEQQRAARPNMRTDIEVREIEPTRSAGAPREYEIFADTDPFTVVRSFYAADDQAAQAILDQYRQDHPGTYYRAHRAPVPGSTLALQRQRAAAAQQQVPLTPDQQQGGLVDVASDQPATAPRTLTVPGQPQQQFTGEWKVVDANGNEIYRFGGVGNAQSDANRVAIDWLRRNPRHMQAGVEVLPVMS